MVGRRLYTRLRPYRAVCCGRRLQRAAELVVATQFAGGVASSVNCLTESVRNSLQTRHLGMDSFDPVHKSIVLTLVDTIGPVL